MRGTGLARGHSHPGTSSGYKRSKSGNMKGTLDDVVLIDVDSDVSSNVVVIDVPQPPIKRKLRGSNELRKQQKFPHHGVISIDDDESDVMDCPGIGDKGGGELDSDATSSKRSCPASKSMQNSEDLDGDECWVVHEKKSSFRLSKCKQTSLDKAACRQRYGLNHESESSSSESDCSDCEVMEGSFGKLHEQWEKASLKRKLDLHKGQSSLNDHTNIYGSHIDGENGTEEHPEVPVCSGWSNEDNEKVTQSAFVASVDECMEDTAFSSGMGIPFANSDQRVHRTFMEDPPLSYEWWRAAPSNSGMGIPFANSDQRVNPMFTEDPPLSYEWWGPNNDNICSNGFCSGEQSSRRSPLSTDPERCDQQSKCARSNDQGEIHGDLDGSVLRNKEDEFPQVPSTADICDETHGNLDRVEAIFKEKVKADSEELFFSKPQVIETAKAPETHDVNIPLLAQDVNVTPSSQKDIINEREKLKETDEYKRAIEAEWASRQRQLQIQVWHVYL
ncbi:hypothetical protein CJ030_MR7G015964 [Morella rubra]|uniref:Uncharacterized protein n=1 Tax=Morella rubra TaxID=262757 RepID=A0A6A1V1K9_9ROSI|nr:hypothetical protein CJ030_MR7G015964 [Morella rubra]